MDGGARVTALEVVPVRLAFKHSFGHHRAKRKESRPQIVRLRLADGTVGYGESLPRSYVTGETELSVRQRLGGELRELIVGQELPELRDVESWLRTAAPRRAREESPAAFCGLELALLDAIGRRTGRSVGELLGSRSRSTLPYDGAVIGFLPAAAQRLVLSRLRTLAPRVVKVKVGRPDDAERLAMVRRDLGDGVDLIIDANGAWSVDQAIESIRTLERFSLTAVEQPVAGRDFDGFARVAAAVGTPLMADESLATRADAERLLALGAAKLWNLRVGKCGGLMATVELARLASAQGIPCQLGILVGESGVLTTAGRLLAARFDHGFEYLEADGFGNLRDDILVEKLPAVRGVDTPAPALRPGLGIEVDEDRLARFSAVEPGGGDVGDPVSATRSPRAAVAGR